MNKTTEQTDRYAELDALRGISILLMIVYHFLFDLQYFYGFDLPIPLGLWKMSAYCIASVFLLLMGIGFVLFWKRTKRKDRFRRLVRRFIVIAGAAIAISVVTWHIVPDAFVQFGILHLIAVSTLLQPLFISFGVWNVLFGIGIVAVGMQFSGVGTSSTLLFPFGLLHPGFSSLDYYPLFPWFGVVLLGMGIGQTLYMPTQHSSLHGISRIAYPRWLLWCGRRSLLLYLLHQPVLLAVLSLLLKK